LAFTSQACALAAQCFDLESQLLGPLFCSRSLELLTLEGGGQALHSLLEVSPFSSELVAS
jgi:hypothetical protein